MPMFSYSTSGKTRRSIGGDEVNYDATGTLEAATPQEAEDKVRNTKVGVSKRIHSVKVWPKS